MLVVMAVRRRRRRRRHGVVTKFKKNHLVEAVEHFFLKIKK